MPVGHEIYRAIDEQSQKLGKVFIAVKQLDQHQKKQELGTVGQHKSTDKK